jgi:1,4-dihydroxy-2-naphthoate octaprenyltransferase
MLLGALVAVLFGSALAGWYTETLGLSDALAALAGVRP